MTRDMTVRKATAVRGLVSRPDPLLPSRVWAVMGVFLLAFLVLGVRMGLLAMSAQPSLANGVAAPAGPVPFPERAEILDRNGQVLATNVPGWSLHARPNEIADHAATARALSKLLNLDAASLEATLRSGKQFVWIKQRVFSHEKQAVQDLGLTGLVFTERRVRVYPLGSLVAHVVGGVRTHRVENWGAEIVGVGGVELFYEERLREGGAPVTLSIDRRAQAILHDALKRGIEASKAKGGSAVLMDVSTGEIFALVSFPDFDPNNRPRPLESGLPDDDPVLRKAYTNLVRL